MVKQNSSQQIPAEVFLVATGNQAVLATGTLAGSGTALNIASGRLGAVSHDPQGTRLPGAMLQAADAYTDVTRLKLVQGTPNSANISLTHPMGIGHKAVVESPMFDAKEVQSVACTKFAPATNGAVVLRGLSGAAVNTPYILHFDIEGQRLDMVEGDNWMHQLFTVTTPATAPSNYQDFIFQNIGLSAATKSTAAGGTSPFVIFGLKLAGGSGTALSAIQAGTSVNFATVAGTTYSYTFDTESIATFQAAVAATATTSLVAATTIEVLGTVTPGSAATVDALIIMTLPDPLTEASDYVYQRRYALKNVGFNGNLVYTQAKASAAFEGFGYARQLLLQFNKRARLQQYSNQNEYTTMMPFVTAPSYIDETLTYSVTTIAAESVFQSLNDVTTHSKRINVLLPCAISNPTAAASGTYTVATTASTTVTGLNNVVGAWLKSANDVFGHIKYLGASTEAAPFA